MTEAHPEFQELVDELTALIDGVEPPALARAITLKVEEIILGLATKWPGNTVLWTDPAPDDASELL